METIKKNTINENSNEELENRFLNTCEQISKILLKYDIAISPHSLQSRNRFNLLDPSVQNSILHGAQMFLDFCNEAEIEKIDLNNESVKLTWMAIRKLGLLPDSSLFSSLTNEHIIEIYNSEAIQIYRSLNLLRYLSYSISDLFVFEWWELYRRDEQVFESMKKMHIDLLNGKYQGVVKTSFPDHYVEEIFSPYKYKAIMRHEVCSPLYDSQGKIKALISAFKIVNSKSN
jgi:hypothetical protein